MAIDRVIELVLSRLNPEQRDAATHDMEPLVIIAGAGTGKTTTLVHRVAWLLAQGIDPSRVLLLTFTRRAAAEMVRRVGAILEELNRARALPCPVSNESQAAADAAEPLTLLMPGQSAQRYHASRIWGGTFHAVATRLLRRYGKAIGLPAEFSVHDQGDSQDLMSVVRTELGLAKGDKRFPKKGTCLAIYSRCVNGREKLDEVLANHFPWCQEWVAQLKQLFDGYVDRKEAAAVLDYDDLLMFWHSLLGDAETGNAIRRQFDCVLVDEYQDTNVLQAEIIYQMCPGGKGLTVVGDDAQSIYSFRAATVRNILDFPKHYPGAQVITLEQNYRSTMPILKAANRVIEQAKERYEKNLWSQRTEGERPWLVTCEEEGQQTDLVIRRILTHREEGIPLHRQAVLFRASHHSMMLEAELGRQNIPFHKYGGLKFVETAHIKDLLGFLRLAENPRDVVAGTRVLPLLPGVGPTKARQLMLQLMEAGGDFHVWKGWAAPAPARSLWGRLVELLGGLTQTVEPLSAQVHRVRDFYGPLAETLYDNPAPRLRDLEQLEQIASRYPTRQRMLLEMTLDPPSSTQDLAGPPHKEDDYLVLSTIHSAKGLEWDAVYVIHVSDGNIPSDMATKDDEQIEEERRLFYVALTRAKSWLYVCCPLRYYYAARSAMSDGFGFAQRSRFLPKGIAKLFLECGADAAYEEADEHREIQSPLSSDNVRRQAKKLWF